MQDTYGGTPTASGGAPPRGGNGLSRGLSIVACILSAVALVVSFAIPGPEGPAGVTGAQGATGATGQQGLQGDPGATGPQGDAGANGTHCWDLNGNGIGDVATEDLNGDSVVNVDDCTGPEGPQGPQGNPGATGPQGPAGSNGTACWDLNGNGIGDVATEDLNGDSIVDVLDCTGPTGPGSIMAYAERVQGVPLSGCVNYISVNITVPQAGSIVLISSAHGFVEHTAGTVDIWTFMTRSSPTDCGIGFTDPPAAIIEISHAHPSDSLINVDSGLVNMYTVAAAGTYTYHLNSQMSQGLSVQDSIVGGSVVAIFYPS